MSRKKRFDVIRLDRIEKTSEGFLKASVRATRTGVFVYKKADGSTFRELRLPEEIFKDESRLSLAMKPVTNNHPYELVNVDNVKEYSVGYTGENVSVEDEKFLATTIVITDKKTIAQVDDGKQEVSLGYELDLEMKEGYWDEANKNINQDGVGEAFDAIQRNVAYNHLAIVDKGRAGPEVRLRLDSEFNLISQEEKDMPKLKIGDKEFDVEAGLKTAIDAMMNELTALKAKKQKKDAEDMAEANARIDELEKQIEETKGRLDSVTEENKKLKDPQTFRNKVNERLHVISTAKAIMKDAKDEELEKLDAMGNVDVMKTAIKATNKDVNLDDATEGYIKGRFDSLAETINADNGGDDETGKEFGKTMVNDRKGRTDGGDDAETEKIRQDRITKDSEAWKQPL